MSMKRLTEKQLRARLNYIQRITSGRLRYTSDLGRLMTISRLSNLKIRLNMLDGRVNETAKPT